MPSKTKSPYGSWKSPLSATALAASTIRLKEVQTDGTNLFWLEMRPTEAGRYVIVKQTADGKTRDWLPAPFSARSLVHEYGGGSFLIEGEDLFFSNYSDQRIYRRRGEEPPVPLTPAGSWRFADFALDATRQRLLAVGELHAETGLPRNCLVALALGGGEPRVIVEGGDFYSDPRLSPDGSRLAWLTWNHPRMPWDGTELWLADLDQAGQITKPRRIAGGENESIFQPSFSPEGDLYFVSDRTDFWNLYRYEAEKETSRLLLEKEAEFGRPQWVFRDFTYGFLSQNRLLSAYTKAGEWKLGELDTRRLTFTAIESEFTEIDSVVCRGELAAFIGASPKRPSSVVTFRADSRRFAIHKMANEPLAESDVSLPQAIEFPTTGNLTAHAFFYRPQNHLYEASPGEKPPLIVMSHGGPTGATRSAYEPSIQYWTTRGFAVVDVNYGGSTGYGKAYRNRLRGNWGVTDVDDCAAAARFLAEQGLVDEKRLAIRGGSAGGYTTLAALTFRKVFGAGASHYGVSDIELLSQDTHKFESRYNDYLVGPYPEARELLRSRSPIHFTEQISCPLILFQGLEDKVVPPSQSELIFEAVKGKGIPVAYVPFPGEQHGFRRAENITRALEAELYFYAKVFRFETADKITPVEIYNL